MTADYRTLPDPTYRWLDRLTKLLGLALVAAGLEVGGDTAAGLALAVAGVLAGVATVFLRRGES